MTARDAAATIIKVTISRLGTGMPDAPTTLAAAGADGRLEIFVVGVDDAGGQALWHSRETDLWAGWSNWVSHGSPAGLSLNSAPACAQLAPSASEELLSSALTRYQA
jgi:hypothetical protein